MTYNCRKRDLHRWILAAVVLLPRPALAATASVPAAPIPAAAKAYAARSPDPATARIALNLFDGARRLLPPMKFFIRVSDGNHREVFAGFVKSSRVLIKDLPLHENFDDDYTVLASANGYRQAGRFPVRLSPSATETVDLMLMPKHGRLDFARASWESLRTADPELRRFLAHGRSEDAARNWYGRLTSEQPEVLAGLLTVAKAASLIRLPSGTAFSRFRELVWDDSMKKDHFYAYADKALLEQVRTAAASGGFVKEWAPGILHSGATASYKQTEFGEGNVQFTFYENDRRTIDGVECIKVETDMDLYRDPIAHFLLEIIPQGGTRGHTDPLDVYRLRWAAGRRAKAPEFDPLYDVARD